MTTWGFGWCENPENISETRLSVKRHLISTFGKSAEKPKGEESMFSLSGKLKQMKWMTCGLTLLILGLMFCLEGGIASASGVQAGEVIGFRWAFGALLGNNNERKLERVAEEATLKTGDQFKMMVELEKPCFVYVIYYNSKDGVKMLFPYDINQFQTDYQVAKKYYIPQGDAWFELDQHVGRETFHLLASAQRLTAMEELFNEYETADAAKRSELIKRILYEIQSIKNINRELAAPAERPGPIGGAIRGMEKIQGNNLPDVASIAEDIACTGSIARTYNIEHQ